MTEHAAELLQLTLWGLVGLIGFTKLLVLYIWRDSKKSNSDFRESVKTNLVKHERILEDIKTDHKDSMATVWKAWSRHDARLTQIETKCDLFHGQEGLRNVTRNK